MKEKLRPKNNLKKASVGANNRGITIISLIITIIVMLILVSVIITVAISGGLFDYAKRAKQETEIAKAEEIANLALVDYNIDKYLAESHDLLSYVVEVLRKSGYTVSVEKANEISITKEEIKIVPGISENLEVVIEDSTTGKEYVKIDELYYEIKCDETKGNIEIRREGKKKLSSADKPITIEPSSSLEGKVKINGTTGSITIEQGTTLTAEGIEVGTGSLIVSCDGETVNQCNVNIVEFATAEMIAANPKAYYGREVTNYKSNVLDEEVYRIFFVDDAGEFGEKNTIYLKADYSGSYAVGTKQSNGTRVAFESSSQTKLADMNPGWKLVRGTVSETNWTSQEKAAAYLCDPVDSENVQTTTLPWKDYYNKAATEVKKYINFVIGGPSVEMYVKSYNQVEAYKNATATEAQYNLGSSYVLTNGGGYTYTIGGAQTTISGGNQYYTGANSLDVTTTYGNMYCGRNGSKSNRVKWWLASPIAWNAMPCSVDCDAAQLGATVVETSISISPLISLKPTFEIEVGGY